MPCNATSYLSNHTIRAQKRSSILSIVHGRRGAEARSDLFTAIIVNTSVQAAWCEPMIMLVRRGFYAPNERNDNSHILHVLSECMQSHGITPVHTHKALAFRGSMQTPRDCDGRSGIDRQPRSENDTRQLGGNRRRGIAWGCLLIPASMD